MFDRARDSAVDIEPPAETLRDPESKTRHLTVCQNGASRYDKSAGFDLYDFENQSLPEIALDQVDISTDLVGKRLQAPLMIAPMTGGNSKGLEVNRVLAAAAERWQIAMGVGSQRLAIEDCSREIYYRIRDVAPTVALFANVGGAQLVRGWGIEESLRAVEMIEADALFIHLNALQEAIQGGDHDFSGLSTRIRNVCCALDKKGIPVYVREVGFGLSAEVTERLLDCGVSGIDCAGAGGTSWSKAEALCTSDVRRKKLGNSFAEWGIPTCKSIQNVRQVDESISLIATGGLTNGIDLAKALALGADIGSMARTFLIRAHEGEEALDQFIEETLAELRICFFGVGAANLSKFRKTPCLKLVDGASR